MTLILLFISVKVDFMLKPFSVNKENKETLPSNKSASYSNAYLNISFGTYANSPELSGSLPLSYTGHHISRIKSSSELYSASLPF